MPSMYERRSVAGQDWVVLSIVPEGAAFQSGSVSVELSRSPHPLQERRAFVRTATMLSVVASENRGPTGRSSKAQSGRHSPAILEDVAQLKHGARSQASAARPWRMMPSLIQTDVYTIFERRHGRPSLVAADIELCSIAESKVGVKASKIIVAIVIQETVEVEVIENIARIEVRKFHVTKSVITKTEVAERLAVHVRSRLLYRRCSGLAVVGRLSRAGNTIGHRHVLVLVERSSVLRRLWRLRRGRWWSVSICVIIATSLTLLVGRSL